jgi:hypothetical protein
MTVLGSQTYYEEIITEGMSHGNVPHVSTEFCLSDS